MQDSLSETASEPRPTGTLTLIVIPMLVLAPALMAQRAASKAGMASAFLLFNWAFYLGWAWLAAWLCRRTALRARALVSPPAHRESWLGVFIAIPLLAITVSALMLQLLGLSFVSPRLARLLLESNDITESAHSLWAVLVSITGATLVPFVEELVFRGVLLHLWTRRYGFRKAVIWTSLLFGVMHLDPIGSFIFGVAMVGLYVRSGSLLVPVVTHCLYNGLALIDGSGNDVDSFTVAELHRWALPAALVFIGGLALLWFVLAGPKRPAWGLPSMVEEPMAATPS